MKRPEPCRAPLRLQGFTLIEVMASVALLGLALAMLARVSVGALNVEGDAVRRARASLLADRVLDDIESQAASGGAPELGERRFEEEGLRVSVDVEPFDLATVWSGLSAPPTPPSRPGSHRTPTPEPLELLTPASGRDPALLLATVQVEWDEGVFQRQVGRTTLLYDGQAAEELLQKLPPPAAPAAQAPAESNPGGGGPS